MNVHEGTSGRLFGSNCTAQPRTWGTLRAAMTSGTLPGPHDAAQHAPSSIPVYGSIQVAMHVGGERYAIDPLSEPVFPTGPGLSLDDLRLAVDRLRATYLAGDQPLASRLGMWPAPDPFEHADPAAVWSLLRAAEIGEEAFQATEESRLVPSDGWRLGTNPDWRHVLEEVQRAGLRHVWFTLLGLEDTHDALCGRPGAFAAAFSALERCAAVGLDTGVNIVVSTRNTHEIGRLAARVRARRAQQFVPTYIAGWAPASARYEAIRPEPKDLAGLPPAGHDVNWGYAWFWADPASFTEGALTRAALNSLASTAAEPQDARHVRELPLLVDANLDVFAGSPAAPLLTLVANLRRDTAEEVSAKLVALEWPPRPPSDTELAARYGDPDSRKVHPDVISVRRKWIAAWRAEQRLTWLATF